MSCYRKLCFLLETQLSGCTWSREWNDTYIFSLYVQVSENNWQYCYKFCKKTCDMHFWNLWSCLSLCIWTVCAWVWTLLSTSVWVLLQLLSSCLCRKQLWSHRQGPSRVNPKVMVEVLSHFASHGPYVPVHCWTDAGTGEQSCSSLWACVETEQ